MIVDECIEIVFVDVVYARLCRISKAAEKNSAVGIGDRYFIEHCHDAEAVVVKIGMSNNRVVCT
jgi:hypothetical protein